MAELFTALFKTATDREGTKIELRGRDHVQGWLDSDPNFLTKFDLYKLVPVETKDVPVSSTRKVIV